MRDREIVEWACTTACACNCSIPMPIHFTDKLNVLVAELKPTHAQNPACQIRYMHSSSHQPKFVLDTESEQIVQEALDEARAEGLYQHCDCPPFTMLTVLQCSRKASW